MTRLPYDDALFQVLSRVERGVIVHHDEAEAHAPGFSWQQSDMSVEFQECCIDALHAGLIFLGHHEPWGSAVSLSSTGEARLAEWRAQRLAGLRGVA